MKHLWQLLLRLFRRSKPVCPHCNGCGYVANTSIGEPWTEWLNVVNKPDYIFPLECPQCRSR